MIKFKGILGLFRNVTVLGGVAFTLASVGASYSQDSVFQYHYLSGSKTELGTDIYDAMSIGSKGEFFAVTRDGSGSSRELEGAVLRFTQAPGKWKVENLSNFTGTLLGRRDGKFSVTSPVLGSDGVLYGVTEEGGVDDCGIVYALKKGLDGRWSRRTVFNFRNRDDLPCNPTGKLILQRDGSIIGTSQGGGNPAVIGRGGTVYRFVPPANDRELGSIETLIKIPVQYKYDLSDICDITPDGKNGFFVGVCGNLTVAAGLFKLNRPSAIGRAWRFDYIHTFEGGLNDGHYFQPSLVALGPDEVIGVTRFGGRFNGLSECSNVFGDGGCGTFYSFKKIGGTWTKQIRYNFRALPRPNGTLLPSRPVDIVPSPWVPGEFIGVSSFGGETPSEGFRGTIFKLVPNADPKKEWSLTVLHEFPEYTYCCGRLTTVGRVIYGTHGGYENDISVWSIRER